jgi:hypothetical protein
MAITPKGLSEEKAARMMVALRGGGTLNKFGLKAPRLEAYAMSVATGPLPLLGSMFRI